MNRYSQLKGDQLEEHFSNFLLDSWSYSKVACFARNMADFERTYIYQEKSRRSIVSIAGNAYHEALQLFFSTFNYRPATLSELLETAQGAVDAVADEDWKLTDKFTTIESAKAEASRLASFLVQSFWDESATYTENIAKVISVEEKKEAWVSVSGNDIPLPLHYICDLVVETKDGKTAIVDHKSKAAYTKNDEALRYTYGQQAITYVLGTEATSDLHIDEVWLVENKTSKNRDGSAQLHKTVFQMDADSRTGYERHLYRNLKPMLQAVSNPDFIYPVNSNDNFCEVAELYDFIQRIEEATSADDIPETRRELIARRKREIAAHGEEWKDIPGFEGLYKVSNKGAVLSCRRTINTGFGVREQEERLIRPQVSKGEQFVYLSRDNRCRRSSVSRLVALAFVPNLNNGKQVLHTNGDKLDNRASNLCWTSPKANA